ncbi:MAG TPA: LuxR C-terminal-related transcriptional regulator, partial [Gaiellaceae bacterium]|nr:LuxR C-terminal-related transcriptional regulator [Gaiellaceae bacterium]
ALAARSDQRLVAARGKALLAWIYLAAGDEGSAERLAREAVDVVETRGLADQPGSGVAFVALGAVVARRGATKDAWRLLDRGLASLRAAGEPLDLVDALLVAAPVRRALGAPEEARALLAEARALVEGCADAGVLQARLEEVARGLTPAHRRAEGDTDLTERELEVLRFLAEGHSKREIGEALFLSFNTIHSHTKSIYQKLRVSSREAAIARARERGVL